MPLDDIRDLQHEQPVEHAAMEELSAARELHEQALALRRQVLGEYHPDTTIAASNLFSLLWQQEDQEEAHRIFAKQLAWLLDAEPDTLSARQRQIQQWLRNNSNFNA